MHETGVNAFKEDTIISVLENSEMEIAKLTLSKEWISDYFSENLIVGIDDHEDLMSYVSQISELRTTFKECIMTARLKLGENQFDMEYSNCNGLLYQVSKYILQATRNVLN